MFLLDYATLPDEDIKLNDTTFSWPDRILPIISYSDMRLRKKIEQVYFAVSDHCAQNHCAQKYLYIYAHANCASRSLNFVNKNKNTYVSDNNPFAGKRMGRHINIKLLS